MDSTNFTQLASTSGNATRKVMADEAPAWARADATFQRLRWC